MMEKAKLMPFLDLIVSASDVSLPKPDPEIYLAASNLLGLSPEECLVIEDSQFGLASAMSAGCHVLKVDSPDDVYFEKIISHLNSINIGSND